MHYGLPLYQGNPFDATFAFYAPQQNHHSYLKCLFSAVVNTILSTMCKFPLEREHKELKT